MSIQFENLSAEQISGFLDNTLSRSQEKEVIKSLITIEDLWALAEMSRLVNTELFKFSK